MVNPQLRKRKIVVLGSRSVGEYIDFLLSLNKNFQNQEIKTGDVSYLLGKSSLVKQFIEVFRHLAFFFSLFFKKYKWFKTQELMHFSF